MGDRGDSETEACRIDDLPDGAMRAARADEATVLLTREGETVHAVGATCPHAGGPLAQGVRNGTRIVCPWHKATFCLRTGTVLEPPAVDPLPRYRVRLDRGRVLVAPCEEEASAPAADPRCFVIVGGGAAGALAAQTLREAGYAGRLVVLDRENRVPYDRTLLSKYFLSGEPGAEKSPLQSQSFYRARRIERRTAEVIRLDAASRLITCADGGTLRYDKALLATGGIPRRPALPGATLRNVFLLRTRADADAILARAEASTRAVVLGASFIGMEVAASLRERGLEVTVVGKEAVPFAPQLGPRVGEAFLGLHRAKGVAFRLGQAIAGLRGGEAVREVELDDGARIPADLVVIGFGIRPATGYLQGVDVAVDGSVRVGADLRVADDLYAAGDIARFPLYGDGEAIRVEHWRVAEQHGRIAALNMAGRPTRYAVTPVFWTIQYMKRMDYIGHATEWDDVVVHGDLGKPEFLAYYVRHGHVAAAAGLDRDKDTAALIELFNRRHDWTAVELGAEPSRLLG